ncbi:triacylglycerol lipase [Lysobacter sp. N42]|jgi:pimeloyl-ACP methyl ester carboxylesterase|uniref:esterase/lipase family protein n=1 Tax=Lysobacter sp. N42 TaxID=2545719 RepID=UPI001FB57C14|nr:alpha/beta fold hydrolase [Lysobacter sp. N42]
MMPTRRVLLLHGLWMWPGSLALLDRRLRAAGFATERIGYSSVRDGPLRAVDRLARAAGGEACHVVAHSLGGLITLAALERHPGLPVRRVVCLGSPLCGSAAADAVARLPLVGRALGRNRRLLRRGCAPWRGRAEVGMVAGTLGFGLGRFVGRIDGPSDGTVALAETRLPGLADHLAVRASHMGLVLSPAVARQVAAFLEQGRFAR